MLFWILVPLFLLLLSYKLVLAFYPLTAAQEKALQFLNNAGELIVPYSAAEVSHLEDVATVMKRAEIVFFLSGMVILGISFYFRKNKEQLHRLLKYGGIGTLTAVLVILTALILNFNSLFTLFHQIFFPQGNWQFAANSLLIQTFLVEFFVSIGRRIFILTLIFGGVFIGTAYLLKKKMKKEN